MVDEFTFTMPPVACLFGEHEHVERIYTSARGSFGATFVMATVLLAADAAAQAIAGRSNDFPHTTCEMGTREHQTTRAALHAFLMSTSPDVAIAIDIVDRHPQSEGAQPREGWPPRCTRIGSRPDVPAWVGPEAAAEAHQRSWAELVRQRIKSLACSSLAVEITLNKEAPRV